FYITFYGDFRGTAAQQSQLHDWPLTMSLPLIIMVLLSIFRAALNIPQGGCGRLCLCACLIPVSACSDQRAAPFHLSHQTEYLLMGLSAVGAVAMAIWAYTKYVRRGDVPKADTDNVSGGLYRLSYEKLYIDQLYDALVSKPLQAASKFFHNVVDKLGIDGVVNSIGELFYSSGKGIRLLQSGHVGFYLFMMVIGVVAFMLYGLLTL